MFFIFTTLYRVPSGMYIHDENTVFVRFSACLKEIIKYISSDGAFRACVKRIYTFFHCLCVTSKGLKYVIACCALFCVNIRNVELGTENE